MFCLALIAVLSARVAVAIVSRVEVDSIEPVLENKKFGAVGAYELVRGRMHFSFDPKNPRNAAIVDIQFAPRNQDGHVEAAANFAALRPKDDTFASGIALVEVSNRGSKFSLGYFNRAADWTLQAGNPPSIGDGLLMRRGLTVVWIGWQFDVPEGGDRLRLRAPVARNPDGTSITGLVRSDWTVDEPRMFLELGHRGHRPYAPFQTRHPDNVLTERDGRDLPRRIVPRELWRFWPEESGGIDSVPNSIFLSNAFKPGRIYELVYRAKDPSVVGLGLGVIRDVIAYAKYNASSIIPVHLGIAAGVSQTGRFLRHFLYQGFNTDESGRRAYDGMMIMTAGAGRGSFNHRFAQPSRDAHPYSAFFYPTDIFPFSSSVQIDAQTGIRDGLLNASRVGKHVPKIFYINTGYEYWGRAASLIHTTLAGDKDVAPMPNERIYHIAGAQHYADRFPPSRDEHYSDANIYRGNPLELAGNYRALLIRLIDWVSSGKRPPANMYPQIENGSLVPVECVVFPAIPGLEVPRVAHVAYRVDYGPRWKQGIIDWQPPRLLAPYTTLVPQVDRLGNELGGIRNVEIRAPLATYTPWSLRSEFAGGREALTNFRGTFIPLPVNNNHRVEQADPRPALSFLYASKADFITKVRTATRSLILQGFLLAEDRGYVLERAMKLWDWVHDASAEDKLSLPRAVVR